ncbi:MAG: hypothetical protein IGS03_05495 [Candidatus Sericytochromatia bacterium]|nr:hypothetical protein [Candidatus Sericytochromatia bacterium]
MQDKGQAVITGRNIVKAKQTIVVGADNLDIAILAAGALNQNRGGVAGG